MHKFSPNFFDAHAIDLNINQLIQDNTLILEETPKEKDKFYTYKEGGFSYYDDFGKRKISVLLEETILDAITLIYEVTHYRNQPLTRRSFTNDLLTESLSYAVEFIFLEDLKNTNFITDRNFHFQMIGKLIYQFSYQIYYIYKIILPYKTMHDITKEAYENMFDDQEFEETIDFFEKYVLQEKSILSDTWNLVGFSSRHLFSGKISKRAHIF